jgi:hypothetical protein
MLIKAGPSKALAASCGCVTSMNHHARCKCLDLATPAVRELRETESESCDKVKEHWREC